jgi:hypothetical protein
MVLVYRIFLFPILALLLSACSVLRLARETPTPAPTLTVRVTADEIARAMQEDHFYSDYRGKMLSIEGTVASISQQGNQWLVEFKTSDPAQAFCDLGSQAPSFRVGDAILVQAEARDAERDGSSVILENCRVK